MFSTKSLVNEEMVTIFRSRNIDIAIFMEVCRTSKAARHVFQKKKRQQRVNVAGALGGVTKMIQNVKMVRVWSSSETLCCCSMGVSAGESSHRKNLEKAPMCLEGSSIR